MPPTTRKRAAVNKADTISEKSAKVIADDSEESRELKLIWQWQYEKDKWRMMENASILTINLALKTNSSYAIVLVDGKDIKYDMQKFLRQNEDTGEEWPICCCVKTRSDKVCYVWSLKDSKGVISYYPPDQVLSLELEFRKNNSSLVLNVARGKLTINFSNWTQTSNFDNKVYTVIRTEYDLKGNPSKSKTNSSTSLVTETVKTFAVTGTIPVDSECGEKVETARVYNDGKTTWNAMLNQTNLQFNNNKFYIIQLLEENNTHSYSVWFRWGRVGQRGQSKLVNFGNDVEKACLEFKKKFKDKTCNEWQDAESFEKVPGKYDLIYVDYTPKDENKEENFEQVIKKSKVSKLDEKIQKLIKIICDIKAMEESVIEMKYDSKKAPLGKLTSDQIKAGYESLKRIEKLIHKNSSRDRILEECNNFYTKIPHNFGMRRPPVIDSVNEIKEKMTLLEALSDIEITLKMMKETHDSLLHPIDNHYLSLRCDLIPLEENHKEFEFVKKYLHDSHGSTHTQFTLQIEEIFKCRKDKEYDKFRDVGNKKLLWHGSRISNWASILSKGLQIAPPEAPSTGYMFGKGVYFADRSSKSANYCFATRSKNIGLLLLCEVALGDQHELYEADIDGHEKLPDGKNSTFGKGRNIPDPDKDLKLDDGVIVPLGPEVKAPISGVYSLIYNEYVVYNVDQIRMRYLVKVKFNFS